MCDNGFRDNSASAICLAMGYSGSTNWVSGSYFSYGDIQESLNVTLFEVQCSSHDWYACSSTSTRNSNGCGHSEDVFLTCFAGEAIN